MRKYELMLIIIPEASIQEHEEIKNKISTTLSEEGGTLSSWQIWKDRRKFSYPIRSRGAEKKKYEEGCYILVEFKISPHKISRLKYVLDLEERILRYLIIKRGEENG